MASLTILVISVQGSPQGPAIMDFLLNCFRMCPVNFHHPRNSNVGMLTTLGNPDYLDEKETLWGEMSFPLNFAHPALLISLGREKLGTW